MAHQSRSRREAATGCNPDYARSSRFVSRWSPLSETHSDRHLLLWGEALSSEPILSGTAWYNA
jgi:hypothetical protein